MQKIIHLRAGGGVGDFIYSYFKKQRWKLLEAVKQKHPNIPVAVVLTCHSSSAQELIAMNPHIDLVLTQEWFPPKHKKEKLWQELISSTDIKDFAREKKIEPVASKLYLHKKEQEILKEIKKNKYIVCHPFAGLPHRGCFQHPKDNKYKCFPDYKYKEVLNDMITEGYHVVLVGRSERNMKGIRNNTESFDFDKEKVHNFIDNASLRLSTELTRQASGFIGTHSSMLSAAWTNGVPSVFFYPARDEHGNVRSIKEHGGETGNWALDKPWTHGYEHTPEEFLELDSSIVTNKLIKLIGEK
jgi:ADP-heptose:LPS heptosyltransferase